jgi:hypothetical protein
MQLRSFVRALAGGCLTVLSPLSASAEVSLAGWLEVERHDRAAACPDAPSLRTATEALLDSAPLTSETLIRVEFERSGARFAAHLSRQGTEGGSRKISGHDDCATLAQAVATALAVMLETRLPAAPQPAPSSAEPPAPARPRPVQRRSSAPTNRFGLAAEGGIAWEIMERGAPFLAVSGALQQSGLRASLGGLWVPSQSLEFGPGEVELEFVGASTRLCFRFVRTRAADFWSCSGMVAGVLSARATGYTENAQQARPWLALPLELSVSSSTEPDDALPFGWRAGATLLVPARRHTFSVQGLGRAVEPAPIAGLIWFGLDGAAWF